MVSFDVHKVNRRFEMALRKLEKSSISREDKKLILEFRDYGYLEGLTKTRMLKYIGTLQNLAIWLEVPFRKAEEKDIVRLIRKIDEKDYSEWTKHDYKVVLKKFYKWLNGDKEYPEKVKWVKTTFKKKNNTLPEDLLTPDEVKKMIDSAEHIRNKALISLLYESGCRISEILTMKMKNVNFDEYGAKILVKGKTGMRRIRIISSVPYLAVLYETHPHKGNPEAPLWIAIGTRNRGNAIKYQNIRLMIREVAKKAGIKKRVNPHNFRHSRATQLANYLTEAQMNHYFGWKQGSDMPSTYVHMSGRDIDNKILEINGLKIDKKEKKKEFVPRKCPRCEKTNPPNGKFCLSCGAFLNLKTAINLDEKRKRMDDMMSTLMKDPETQRFMLNKMRQMRMEEPVTS